MDKKKRDLVLAVLLVAVFLATFSKNVLLRGGAKARPSAIAERQAELTDLSFLGSARANEDLLARQRALASQEWGRDPFVVDAEAAAAAPVAGLSLLGVVWDQADPVAMINDEVLHIGGRIGGFQVIEIRPSSVILGTETGARHELKLFEKERPHA